MELNVLLRRQSNADLLSMSSDWPAIANTVQQLLGFDGVTNTVTLLAHSNDGANDNTINGGTAFIGDWVDPAASGWQHGWTDDTLENGLLNYINALPAATKAAPTAVVWRLHNEYDSTNASLTTAEWMSAVKFEAQQVRAALGQSAATVPYLFVNAIPYNGSIDTVNQAIKLGMQQLAADPSFNAAVGVQADDLNMDGTYFGANGTPGSYGGGHMSAPDISLVAGRLARAIAETFAQYAQPNSPVANGTLDAFGPQAVAAAVVSDTQVLVTAALDDANLSKSLSAEAAGGIGWSIIDGGVTLNATAAQVTDGAHVLLTFGTTVPLDGTARLYYAWGYGRLGSGSGDPGEGNAIYDTQLMPIFTAASGVALTAEVACLVAGSEILLADGGVCAVECLRPGDAVRGALRGRGVVKWIGQRSVRFASAQEAGRPVRVLPHAFGPGVPAREVRLSPDHAVFVAGVLIPVHKLVDGVSILRDTRCGGAHYVHVELARHDLLLTAGLRVESFLDTGNRGQFDRECGVRPMRDTLRQGGDGLAATLRAYAAHGCAPLCLDGPLLDAARARLRARVPRGGGAVRGRVAALG